MAININDILQYLRKEGEWVESKTLADNFKVSTRTIRNYIRKINTRANQTIVLSSYHGYKLDNKSTIDVSKVSDTLENRYDYIIRRLLCCNEIDSYDLADELCISDSTLDLDIRKCKNILSQYNLQLKKHRNILSLSGMEQDKRKFMNKLISNENVNDFIHSYNEMLTDEADIDYLVLCQQLHDIFTEEGLFVNDYELNNIAVHIMVVIIRIRTSKSILEDVKLSKIIDTHDYRVSLRIKKMLDKFYSVHMNEAELYYLTLLILSNSSTIDDTFVNMDNIYQYIEEEYINISKDIIKQLNEAYHLDDFDETFFIKFSIHIKNLCFRLKHHYHVQNPLSVKIKKEYPLVYDMAVFVAKELSTFGFDKISDDEIAFIAFHIGAYLENTKNCEDSCSCCFIYTDYHDMHEKCMKEIIRIFGNRIHIQKVLSYRHIQQVTHCDLIISMSEISEYITLPFVCVGPFLSKSDIKSIDDKLISIEKNKNKKAVGEYLRKFVGEQLFYKEVYTNSIEEMIKKLCSKCCQMGLCDKDYVYKVMEREKMSSTSFPNRVAVPHSLLHSSEHSFLSIVINEKPMMWNQYDVNLIILIGFGKDDQEIFSHLFDQLIAALYEQSNVDRLLRCKTYDEFICNLEKILTD